MPARTPKSPEPTPAQAPAPVEQAPVAPAAQHGFVDRLRANRMGGLLGGLVVAVALAMLLSVLVPDTQVLLALVILGAAMATAVGFTVRKLSAEHGLLTQLAAFVAAGIGVHLMATTGVVHQSVGDLGGAAELLGADLGIGWSDALLAGLWTPTISTGAILAGLAAAIIAGWGPRNAEG